MSNDKRVKTNILGIKPDAIKKLNNDIIDIKNKDLQVEKMKKKIGEILSSNNLNNLNPMNSSMLSQSVNFEDPSHMRKKVPKLETVRVNNQKDANMNTDNNKYLNLFGK